MARSHGETSQRQQNRRKPRGAPWKPRGPTCEEWPRSCMGVTSSRMRTERGWWAQKPRQGLRRLRSPVLSFHVWPATALPRTEPTEKRLVRTTSRPSRRGNWHHRERRSKYKWSKKTENLREQAACPAHHTEQEREHCELPSRCSEATLIHTQLP